MMRLRDIVRAERRPAPALPGWLERIISIGIVSRDPDVVRRQRFTNLTAFAAAANAGSHFVINAGYDASALIVVHAYNALFALGAIALPALHRVGDYAAAFVLLTMVAVGNTFVVWMLGIESQLHVYFTLAGVLFFLFGVENWRLYGPWLVLTAVLLVVCIQFAPEYGYVLEGDHELRRMLSGHAMINTLAINAVCVFVALTALRRAELDLADEHARSEALIATMLPARIAARLKAEPDARIADRVDTVCVLFADLVGFTAAARACPPDEVVAFLDDLYRAFDELTAGQGAEKIKTIGDCYMAVSGLDTAPQPAAVALGRLALDLQAAVGRALPLGGARLKLRVGLHAGPATAGVIGTTRFTYDVWGDAVNVAARLESHGIAGRVQVSEAFRALAADAFVFQPRGEVDIRDLGRVATFLLVGPAPAAASGAEAAADAPAIGRG